MSNIKPLSNIRVLVEKEGTFYKYAKIDSLDGGDGLLIYDYGSGEKVSRHSDGTIYTRIAGAGEVVAPTTSVQFSDIRREIVREVPIPKDALNYLTPYAGPLTEDAFIFSSTVLQSSGTFAAEIVADEDLHAALEAWEQHPYYVSAQTCRANHRGKTAILTVINRPSP